MTTPRILLLLTVVAVSGFGAGGDDKKTSSKPPKAAASPLQRAAKSRPVMRATLDLGLRRAALVRRGRAVRLEATPTGRGRISGSGSLRRPLAANARTLATVVGGVSGTARVRARIGGRAVTLAKPRLRRGRLVAQVRGASPRRLGRISLRATVRRRVHARGRCLLVPLSSCPRQRLQLMDALRADLRGIDLRGADLHRAYLHDANLAGADLRSADLRGADLGGADLARADLRGANLADAHLLGARLGGTRLDGAFLCRTRMRGGKARTRRDCGDHAPKPSDDLPARTLRVVSNAAPRAPRAAPAPRRSLRSAATPRSDDGDIVTAPKGCYFYSNTKDADGDRLSDCYEATERAISVRTPADLERDGTPSEISGITSKTRDSDSDDDGLDDGQENTLDTHPGRADTDRDALGDRDEHEVYGSDPLHADSDGDSVSGSGASQTRSSRLYDGAEAKLGVSPQDTDTDGDGRGDQEEILRGGGVQLPTVADLPQFTLGIEPEFTTVGFSIGIERTTGTTTTKEVSSTKLESEEQSQSHGFSVEFGFEMSQEFETKAKVGEPENQAETSSKFGFKESVTAGQTNKWAETKTSESEFGKIQSDETSSETKIDPLGCLEAVLRVSYPSDAVGFELRGIQVLPKVPDPADPTRAAAPMTTLQPVSGAPGFDAACQGTSQTADVVLEPKGHQRVSFQGQVDSGALLEFIANPVPITFVMGKYEIVGPNNESYLPIIESVDKKDAAVTIDFGEREEGPSGVHQFQVAANVRQQRNSAGDLEPAGVTVGEALSRLKIDGNLLAPRYGEGNGRTTLVSLAGVDNAPDPNDGLWTALATRGTGIADQAVDFKDVRLKPGQSLYLRYLADGDDDGVPNAFETITGTDDGTADTDADGLSDRYETKVGWTVPIATPFDKPTRKEYRAFSSPLSCDADVDGSPDGPGKGTAQNPCPKGPPEGTRGVSTAASGEDTLSVGTDPKAADTNRDGIRDAVQPYPQVLQNVPPGARAPVFSAKFGGVGTGTGGGGTFKDPIAIAVDRFDKKKRIYVDDAGSNLIQSFSLERPVDAPAFEKLNPDIDPGRGRSGVAVSPTIVGDAQRGQAGQLLYAGRFATETTPDFSELGGERTDVNFRVARFNGSTGVAGKDTKLAYFKVQVPSQDVKGSPHGHLDVDSNRNLYVATAGNATGKNARKYDQAIVHAAQYDESGRKVRSFGGNALLNPTGIAVDPGRNVYVTESEGALRALHKYDAQSGQLAGNLTHVGDAAGVGVDCNGYVYVLDREAYAVHKYSSDLTYLTSFGRQGKSDGLFQDPVDLEVDSKNNLYVLDKGNHRVQVFTYPFAEGDPLDPTAGALRGCEEEGGSE